jgi:hypothetical protein
MKGASMLRKILCFAAVLFLFILVGCDKSASQSKRITELQNKIQKIEQQCVPQLGMSMQELEDVFGSGTPLPKTESKSPPKEPPPADSPRRAYQLCENGTLVVLYDSDWNVLRAYYINPYSTKGTSIGWNPTNEQMINELEPRLKQIEAILKAYQKKKKL